MLKMTWRGGKEMSAKILKAAENLPKRAARAERAELEIEVTEMKKRTPVDMRPNAPHPGQLRDGIHVEEPEIKGKRIKTLVATSPQSDDYDLIQHENSDFHHEVGQWKYMESVLNESASHMNSRISERLHFDRGDE